VTLTKTVIIFLFKKRAPVQKKTLPVQIN